MGLGSNDALAFSQTQNTSLNVGFPIFIPIIFVCLVAELSAGADAATSNTQMTLQDINGDGLPDEVFKKNDLSDPNRARDLDEGVGEAEPGRAGQPAEDRDRPVRRLLRHRVRSRRKPGRSQAPTPTIPTNHWVMSAMTIRRGSTSTGQPAWNAEPSQRTQYTYANGFYSRADRIFVGFANVTTTHVGTGDQTRRAGHLRHQRRVPQGPLAQARGAQRASAATDDRADENLPVFEVTQNAYEVRPLQSVFDPVMDNRPIFFVPKIRTFTRTYEGGGTNPDARR